MKTLVTGAAGFIGMHTCEALLKQKHVIGIDNLNNYYDVKLKKRLDQLKKYKNFFKFYKIDLKNFKR